MSEFVCATCGLVFERARSDEQALEDGQRVFGKEAMLPGKRIEVCEECYKTLMWVKENYPDLYEQAKEEDRIERSN